MLKKEHSDIVVDDTSWKVGRLYLFALGFPAAADVDAVAVEGGSAA